MLNTLDQPKALLLHLGVCSRVFMIQLTGYQEIKALFILVTVLARFLIVVSSRGFVIFRILSADHCKSVRRFRVGCSVLLLTNSRDHIA